MLTVCWKRFLLSIALVSRRPHKFLFGCHLVAFAIFGSYLNAETEAADANAITGLWVSEWTIPPPASGKLTIEAKASKWWATIAGLRAPVHRDKDTITFTLPNDAGEFRGRFLISKKIVGHWIQPANQINNNRYATPVELLQSGDNLWRGKVEPLEARLSFHMWVRQADGGSLSAVIRNPEFNLFRRNLYQVERRGNAVTFSDTKDRSDDFGAKLEAGDAQLTAHLPNIDGELIFKRRESAKATGFRAGSRGDYKYRKPAGMNDGWLTADLREVDLDSKRLTDLIGKIIEADPVNNSFNIHSLLVARDGKLVLEEYFYGGTRDEPHTMRSASKTFASLLVGIARDEGATIDVETPVYSQFSEYKEFANPDRRKPKITVRDLMTMTSGLACDDNDENSPGNEDVMQQQTAQLDWYKYTLDLPMARDPGGDQAIYCSAGVNLLGGIVRNAAHTWLPEFFYENVAKPLQIKTYHWNLMPNGDGYAAGGLYLRPRDQLKLGQLYLNGGVWNGKRVVSKDWVEKSISRKTTFGKTLGADHDYGYGWHLYHFETDDHSYRAYAAGGNGGQIVMVIPDLELVVGFTGGAYGEFAKWYKWQTELVPQFIIPAATSTTIR
jgi:CubicO group peptidase (beta-lactamase class C family)